MVESIMYFALGALAAGLIALMILPAVWRRAVRLTTKRIEAATPVTMAEFRADKDQLRAEFALSTRRLEMNVEALRKRLSDQMSDIGRKKNDLTLLKSDRDQHLAIVQELEEREAASRRRILELEKEHADLAQRLRMREMDVSSKSKELDAARNALRSSLPPSIRGDGAALSGDYDRDVDDLLTALAVERKRAAFLEEQGRNLIATLETSDRRSFEATQAAAELRKALAAQDDVSTKASEDLVVAEARIASAESRLNALLEETEDLVSNQDSRTGQLLAEKLSLEAQVESLKAKVLGVESQIMADWDSERMSQAHMRERLNDIAADVSRLVYALEGDVPADTGESLFDRVQRFADDGPTTRSADAPTGAVSDRLAAIRELQDRG
jgi:DNA repair exonuclease SbcCD ATPase subunit